MAVSVASNSNSCPNLTPETTPNCLKFKYVSHFFSYFVSVPPLTPKDNRVCLWVVVCIKKKSLINANPPCRMTSRRVTLFTWVLDDFSYFIVTLIWSHDAASSTLNVVILFFSLVSWKNISPQSCVSDFPSSKLKALPTHDDTHDNNGDGFLCEIWDRVV